jgi:hypothetical protein
MSICTATITAEQRDALYELVIDDLSGLADVVIAIEQGRRDEAGRLAKRFGEDFRLLEDLGWARDDDREAVELTIWPEDLVEALGRLRDDARAGSQEPEEVREARALDERHRSRFQTALGACEVLLAKLGANEEGSA